MHNHVHWIRSPPRHPAVLLSSVPALPATLRYRCWVYSLFPGAALFGSFTPSFSRVQASADAGGNGGGRSEEILFCFVERWRPRTKVAAIYAWESGGWTWRLNFHRFHRLEARRRGRRGGFWTPLAC